MAKAKQQ